MYKVIVDHPSIGEGTGLYIHGLGTFKNGTTTEVSDQQIEVYRAAHAVVNLSNPDPGTGRVKHLPALGRHPVDQSIFGVRIEPVDPPSTEEDPKVDEDGEGSE